MLIKTLLRLIIIAFISIILSIAYGFRLYHVMEAGHLIPGSQVEVLPFSYNKSGHIIIKVKIDGVFRDFLVDSGASNIIFEHIKAGKALWWR